MRLTAPFPWFGGKSRAAALIWDRLGDTPNYVEPFAGSLAVLLGRPHEPQIETVNDLDCYVVNFWRAVTADPAAVARYASWPVTEADQNARHQWLVDRAEFRERVNIDPEYFDAKVAGWWAWGLNVYIGDGWCDARFWRDGDAGTGVNRQLPHLGDAGKGVNRKLPNLTTFVEMKPVEGLAAWMDALSARLRRVRVCCGDWTRVLTPSVTTKHGLTAVLLDPPYQASVNQNYAVSSGDIAAEVATWAIEHGDDPLLRIALCGYEGDYQMPASWECEHGRARKGYQRDADAAKKERVWFSPHCLRPSDRLPFHAELSGDDHNRDIGRAV